MPCTAKCADNEVALKPCNSTTNLVCAVFSNCWKSTTGTMYQCIAPQTCLSCSSAEQSEGLTVSDASGANSGSVGATDSGSQSPSFAVGICCNPDDQSQLEDSVRYCKNAQSLGVQILKSAPTIFICLSVSLLITIQGQVC